MTKTSYVTSLTKLRKQNELRILIYIGTGISWALEKLSNNLSSPTFFETVTTLVKNVPQLNRKE